MSQRAEYQTQNMFESEFSTCVHEYEKYGYVAPHFHKSFEIITVISGSCKCSINGIEYTLGEKDSVFISPFDIHTFSLDENSSARRITFHEHLILTFSQALDGRKPISPIFRVKEKNVDFFLLLTDTLFGKEKEHFSRITPYHRRIQTKSLLYLICGDFMSLAEFVSAPSTDNISIGIAKYISKNFKNNITLHDVANEMGYNYQYLSRMFNKVLKVNFKKMLNQYRIEHAFALLQDTNMPISRVCFESGFQSIRSFNQVCLDTFGKTPKDLRKTRTDII